MRQDKYSLTKLLQTGLLLCSFVATICSAQTVDVLIKGVDDGARSSKQQDYREAVMNAKLQAIERAGVEIKSFTQVENFQVKYDLVESRAEGVLLPGFQVMDFGYQEDGSYLVVLSGKVQIKEEIEDARVTIIMNRYKDQRRIGDNISFDLAERGGGIRFYTWEIFPEELIETNKTFFKKHPLTGGYPSIYHSAGHQLTGIDDSNLEKARMSLLNGKSVCASLNGPMSVNLLVPPGRYYIDYSITTNREVMGGRKHAPMQYHWDSWSSSNWGPYEFSVQSGEDKKIIITPNGNNSLYVLDGLNWFLSYIMLETRKSWIK